MQLQLPNLNYDDSYTFSSSLFIHLRTVLLETKTSKPSKLETSNLEMRYICI